MNKRKVFFRADASQTIGHGHFVRSLALADILKEYFDCIFFTQTPSIYQQKEVEKVCSIVCLPSDDSKFDKFMEYITGEEIIVLDNYYYTSEYQKKIKDKGCLLVHIDDIHDRHFYADLIINHGYATQDQYDVEKNTKFCLGPSYALLRKPFFEKTNNTSRIKGKWVVCFGGADPYNLTEKAIKVLSLRNDVTEISAIVSENHPAKSNLVSNRNVTLLSSLSAREMAFQFLSAEYVICSASTVCYEALACGCSVFAGFYVDNQIDFYEGLCKNNFITPLGNLLESDFNNRLLHPQKTVANINIQNASHNLLEAFRALEFRIVNYTDMTEEESRMVWQIRNLPEIRKCMTQQDPFPFESHLSFVESLKCNETKLYYAIFIGNELLGSYDFINIKNGDSAEHGLYINPTFHGKGYGRTIEYIMDEYIKSKGIRHILAEVLKCNNISYNYHLKVGYEVYKEDENYYYLERYIQ